MAFASQTFASLAIRRLFSPRNRLGPFKPRSAEPHWLLGHRVSVDRRLRVLNCLDSVRVGPIHTSGQRPRTTLFHQDVQRMSNARSGQRPRTTLFHQDVQRMSNARTSTSFLEPLSFPLCLLKEPMFIHHCPISPKNPFKRWREHKKREGYQISAARGGGEGRNIHTPPVCAPLCCKNMCCVSVFCLGVGWLGCSRSKHSLEGALKQKLFWGAKLKLLDEAGSRGASSTQDQKTQDNQHKLNQPGGSFTDSRN